MADQTHRPGPTLNLNTRVINNSFTQVQAPSPSQASASAHHFGSLHPGVSPIASTNSRSPDPVLHQRIVEILASTANGCISELGYSTICTRLREIEKAYEELKGAAMQSSMRTTQVIDEQRRTIQTSKHENTKLRLELDNVKQELNRVRQELNGLRQENIMLRTNAPEAFRILEGKYFYALDLLKQQHAPIVTDALRSAQVQPGYDGQVISPVNNVPRSEYPVVSTQTRLSPNTVPTMGPPPHFARKLAQQPLHPSQRAVAGPSHSQPTIPAKRPLPDTSSTSSASTSMELPPSFSRKPTLHAARPPSFSAPPASDVNAAGHPTANRGPTRISAAAIPFSNNGVPSQSSVHEDRVRQHGLSPTEAFPYHFNPSANRVETPRSRSVGAVVNSDVVLRQVSQRTPEPAQSVSNPPTPLTTTHAEQTQPGPDGGAASADVAGWAQSPTSAYPVSIEDMNKLDITSFARAIKNALASSSSSAADSRGSSTPVVSRVEKVQEIPEQRVGEDPGQPQAKTQPQTTPPSLPHEEQKLGGEREATPVQGAPVELASDDAVMKEPQLSSTDAINTRRSPEIADKRAEIQVLTPASISIRPIEADHQAAVPPAEPMQIQNSETHDPDAMDISNDIAVPVEEVPVEEAPTEEEHAEGEEEEEEEEEEEPEEEWGDLTDDETNNTSGAEKRPVVDCISSIFYDDDQDERFCQLCNLRIKNHGLTEAPPTFSDSSMRELIIHAKESHPIPWVKLRQQSNDAAV